MKFFIDTANVKEIREASDMGMVDGVTTNPTLIAREGRPFETIIIPKRHVSCIGELTESESRSFADAIKCLTTRYDNLFQVSFPYSAGLHQAPTDGRDHAEYHAHTHFYPPLLRSATIKKFMVGYEMLANPQRDITPESSAERLRNLSDLHYRKNEQKQK